MKIIREIKWKLFMLKYRLGFLRYDIIDKYMRKNYCRYGIHKLKTGYEGRSGSNQRMKHLRFLRCQFCNYLFFAKKSDKKRYNEWHKKEKEIFSAILDDASSRKRKHHSKIGASESRDVSSS